MEFDNEPDKDELLDIAEEITGEERLSEGWIYKIEVCINDLHMSLIRQELK